MKTIHSSFSSKDPRDVTLKAIINSSNSTDPSLLSSNVAKTNFANFPELPCSTSKNCITFFGFENRQNIAEPSLMLGWNISNHAIEMQIIGNHFFGR